MKRSIAFWLVPGVVTLVGLGSGAVPVVAQTNYQFDADYDVLANTKVLLATPEELFFLGTSSGSSSNAPFGLTTWKTVDYFQLNVVTGQSRFNTDPTILGLQNLPFGFVELSGSGSDKLFGTESGTSMIDFTTSTGTASGTWIITGGAGRFAGATGRLTLSGQVLSLGQTDSDPTRSVLSLNGSFQVPTAVPEPRSVTPLLGMGMIGTAMVLLGRRRFSKTDLSR
jgi:hypothetical protein